MLSYEFRFAHATGNIIKQSFYIPTTLSNDYITRHLAYNKMSRDEKDNLLLNRNSQPKNS
jgi:hypothetical protein